MVHLDYRDVRPIYTQIVDGFREQISTGILQVGDRLPSVRELAATLTINPNTIQRAYRELESAGWIATVPGKGCFVHSIPTACGAQRQALLEELGRITAALLESGMTREELICHLREGGK
mgnify:CR=1 FL=1